MQTRSTLPHVRAKGYTFAPLGNIQKRPDEEVDIYWPGVMQIHVGGAVRRFDLPPMAVFSQLISD